jgi:hypothetical protein
LPTVGNATRIDVVGIAEPESSKQKPLIPAAVVSNGICGGPSLSSSPRPAPHAPGDEDVCPEVHILPPTLVKAVPVGVVTVAQFWFFKSLQSLYENHEPWMPSELLPAATRPVASGMIETPAQGAAAAAVPAPIAAVPVAGAAAAEVLVAAGMAVTGEVAPLSSGALLGTAVSDPVVGLGVSGAGLETLGAPAAFMAPGALPNAATAPGVDAVPESFEEQAVSAQTSEAEEKSERAKHRMTRR